MATITPIARWVAVAAALWAMSGPCRATEMPVYAPIQTEREVTFASVTLGLKERIAALQQRSTEAVHMDYAALDLDGDGEAELFVRLFSGPACQAETCTTMVFNMAGGAWTKVLETTEPEVTVAKQVHRNYRDIVVGSQPWLWAGRSYAPVR